MAPALTLFAVVSRAREGRADGSSDADRPARAAWAVRRLLADFATSFLSENSDGRRRMTEGGRKRKDDAKSVFLCPLSSPPRCYAGPGSRLLLDAGLGTIE